MYSDPNSAQHSALLLLCTVASLSHAQYVHTTLAVVLCCPRARPRSPSRGRGGLSRHRPKTRPCRNTKTMSRQQTGKPCRDRVSVPLKRRCCDTKGHVATPKVMSSHQTISQRSLLVTTPKPSGDTEGPCCPTPCRNTKFSVVTQGKPSLSRQETLCRDKTPKEAYPDRPSQARPRACALLLCTPRLSCRDTTIVSQPKTRNG